MAHTALPVLPMLKASVDIKAPLGSDSASFKSCPRMAALDSPTSASTGSPSHTDLSNMEVRMAMRHLCGTISRLWHSKSPQTGSSAPLSLIDAGSNICSSLVVWLEPNTMLCTPSWAASVHGLRPWNKAGSGVSASNTVSWLILPDTLAVSVTLVLSCLQVQLSDKEPATRSFLSPSAILPAHMRDREIQAIEGLLADADRLEQSLESDRPEKVCLCLCPAHNPNTFKVYRLAHAHVVRSIRTQRLLFCCISALQCLLGAHHGCKAPVLTHRLACCSSRRPSASGARRGARLAACASQAGTWPL